MILKIERYAAKRKTTESIDSILLPDAVSLFYCWPSTDQTKPGRNGIYTVWVCFIVGFLIVNGSSSSECSCLFLLKTVKN